MEPGTKVTLDPDDLTEIDHGKKRVGHPRLNWYQVTLQNRWTVIKKDHPEPSVRFAAALDKKKPTHTPNPLINTRSSAIRSMFSLVAMV